MMAVTPWERQRLERVLRLFLIRELGSDGEDFSVVTHPTYRWDEDWYLNSTPLFWNLWRFGRFGFYDNGNAVVLGRAFEQVLALRIWQVEHDGQYPGSLDALVPDLLPTLPLDPWSGKLFLYRSSEGQKLLPLGLSGRTGMFGVTETRPTRPGSWILYSVGPDRHDDGAKLDYQTKPGSGSDLIFPLPEGDEVVKN